MFSAHVDPRHEVVEIVCGVAIGELGEGLGQQQEFDKNGMHANVAKDSMPPQARQRLCYSRSAFVQG